jgi:flagellar export protein FliJ
MSAFRFRGQAALDFRRRQHDEARRRLADAERAALAAREALAALEATLAAARVEAGELLADPARRHELEWYRLWEVRLQQERTQLEAHLAACQTEVDARRVECLRAQRRVESLERWRDRAAQAYVGRQRAAEQKLMDALATTKFIAAKRAG